VSKGVLSAAGALAEACSESVEVLPDDCRSHRDAHGPGGSFQDRVGDRTRLGSPDGQQPEEFRLVAQEFVVSTS
jgi:hypothetical protein